MLYTYTLTNGVFIHTGDFLHVNCYLFFIVSDKLKDLHKITVYDEYLIQENTDVYPNWKVSSPIG